MPADEQVCVKLVLQFDTMPGFPRGNFEAIGALADTLSERARDNEHAQKIARSIREGGGNSPSCESIIRVSYEGVVQPPGGICGNCMEGWRTIWVLVTKFETTRWKYQRLTEAEARRLEPQIDRDTQEIHTAQERCPCSQRPPSEGFAGF